MINEIFLLAFSVIIFIFGACLGVFLRQNKRIWTFIKSLFVATYTKLDDTRKSKWGKEFEVVAIPSKIDHKIQKAFFYKTRSQLPQPLIVSLHTWCGFYSQKDELANLCLHRDINYIHPDFRGANFSKDACCSELALSDIDESITYAINNAHVDSSRIIVIGGSGGGYATLSTFMKSKHTIWKFSAWASITDLIAWHHESKVLRNNYHNNIMACTESKQGILNETNAKLRSPIYWSTPIDKFSNSHLFIYAGIYDGIQGSVPITQSINFYNKLLLDLGVTEPSKYVSELEKLQLLEYRKPLGEYGKIADRNIFLIKEFKLIKLIVFEGGHELLSEFALNEVLSK